MKPRLLVVFGTRPEAIKMAPLVHELKRRAEFETYVCVTAQHRQMLDQVLEFFEIRPDFDLDIMRPGQDLFDVTANVMLGLRSILRDVRPDYVFVHGDTTTCFAASLAAFYENAKVVHVEAGLRTGNFSAPFPEEMNRCLAARLAHLHFAPTQRAAANLLGEGVDPSLINVTGNTVIDALLFAREKIRREYPEQFWKTKLGERLHGAMLDSNCKKILITGHRRENFGAGLKRICEAFAELADQNPDWVLIYPVHMNPNVAAPVHAMLGNKQNIYLIEPLEYDAFVWMMEHTDVIVTDSGGIQEEAPSLGKPVLVTREVTERPEAVEAGTVKLVGTDSALLVRELSLLLSDIDYYSAMSRNHNPYGDGLASTRISSVVARSLGLEA
ncbi:MAG TPA: UDP-N-acetylglucosamine 2-epimerase (non-hydrolyzing) [Dongiaceae bacterium]|nr:UDP-N-acetylglucosamine 2-epimerase (non-hydrolyzing) [Dongiaceae bacterium]